MFEQPTPSPEKKSLLSPQELNNYAGKLSVVKKYERRALLVYLAQQKSVPWEQIFKEINDYRIAQIKERELGNLRHFHRTSFAAFETILQDGSLLSRSKLKERHPDIELSAWSASDDVMMTRDAFDKEGNLYKPGFSENEVVGATGEITLVIKSAVMDLDDYDALGIYPTISELPLAEYCEVVLVSSEQDRATTQLKIQEAGFAVPVILKSQWERKETD